MKVRRALAALFAAAVFTGALATLSAASFTAGNLVVYRVGTGSGNLVNTGNPVFLDEYAPNGTLVQSVALPTTGSGAQKPLIASGTATSEGLLNRSADGKYLILTGYGTTTGGTSLSATTSVAVPRVVGRVAADGTIDTSTALTDWTSGNNPRSATSFDGSTFWVAGAAGGVRYVSGLGATTTTDLTSTATSGSFGNVRQVSIFNSQVYASSGSGTNTFKGVETVGSGLPTSGAQAVTRLSGLTDTTNPSTYAFFLADLTNTVPGYDTLYVADDGTGALTKFSLVSGSWTSNGTVGTTSDSYRGLTATVSGTTVTLYATRKGGSGTTGGGELVSLTDASGYNGAFSGTPTLLATASANTAFRGVALAPSSGIAQNPNVNLSVSTNSGSEAAQTQVTVTATASAPVSGAQTVSLAVTGTGITAGDYTLSNTTITIPNGSITGSVTFTVKDDAFIEGTETATLTISNPSSGITLGATTTQNIVITDNDFAPVCSATLTPISSVQGSGLASPLVGQSVAVKGVVIGTYLASTSLRGFYLQDLNPDADPATSEGLFVFTSSLTPASVSLGKVLQVSGTVSEFQEQTQISIASLNDVEDCGTTSSVTPVDVTLPVPSATYLERYEGMLVRFNQTLYVTEHFQLGRFGQVVMSSGTRLPQPTSIAAPGAPAQAQQAANDLNRIIVDDELQTQNPDPIEFGRGGNPLSASNTLRGGDSATNMVGVLTYTWAGNAASGNAYRLRPVNALGGGVPSFVATNGRPATAPTVNGRLKVVGMNVLNYFLTLDTGSAICGPAVDQFCRGAESANELSRQQAKLTAALVKLNADVFGFAELENTAGVNPVATIASQVNAQAGPGVYNYIDTGTIGTDAIRVGIMYKPSVVTPMGAFQIDNNAVHNRPPLAQYFIENSTGQGFWLVVNHLKSKGSCPGSGADSDQGDGQACWNATRTQQAQRTLTFVNGLVQSNGDSDVLMVGDFNAYAKEDPITTLTNAGFTNLISRYGGPSAYSYVFDGQWGYLDHGLASPSMLAQITGAGDYHINSDEPSVLDYNTNFKSAGQITGLFGADEFRISDHDPVVLGVSLFAAPVATPDPYSAEAGFTLTKNAGQGLLSNDSGAPLTILSTTTPNHGSLTVFADGSFTYTPAAGFTGQDTFDYLIANSIPHYSLQVYSSKLAPLATLGGVNLTAGGFGSSLARVPGTTDQFYGLTDRGPNVDGPGGTKVEPLPSFTPAIGKFQLSGSTATLLATIPLKAGDGTPYNGRVNTQASTGETITDLNGNVLPADPNGYDSEGLVAMADGTFWVSDEYGPFITHFDANGLQIGRLSPFDASLPVELRNRLANRGMEGLTITPDGSTLVGMMQSALQQVDLGGADAKKQAPVRIVTYKLATGEVHEYLYLLDNPSSTGTAVSEITALSNTQFLVDERDGKYPPNAYKKLHLIDLTGATDVGPLSSVGGATYINSGNFPGLTIGGSSIEKLVVGQNTATASTTLTGLGITPVQKSLFLDVGGLLDSADPQGRIFSHDKLEGVAVLNGGATLVIANDSDFGIDGVTNSVAPFQLHAKVSPTTGAQDDGEFLVIDLVRSSATVTINVTDTIGPETSINTAPTNPTVATSAAFTFSGSDAGSGVDHFECSLDNAPFTTCSSGINYPTLSVAAHTFAVRAVDKSNHTDASPAQYAWTITAAPAVTGQFTVVRGLATLNRTTGRYTQTVTVTNNGAALSSAAYVLDSLAAGYAVYQPSGTTLKATPAGSPYLELGPIGAGASVTFKIELQRTGTPALTYTPRLLGAGSR